MQLNLKTDYAVRILIYLTCASPGILSSAETIGNSMGISPQSIAAIMRPLKDKGWIENKLGATGGYRIAEKPENISLFDIASVTEGTLKINRCLEQDGLCSINGVSSCPVHQFYLNLQNTIERELKRATIASLLKVNAV
ncbi:MAG: Rrf2 family transcriptional regulator [Selenomonadaceae bacterium]